MNVDETAEVTTDPREFVSDYRRLVDIGLATGDDVAFQVAEAAWLAANIAEPDDDLVRHLLWLELIAVAGVDFVLVDPYDEGRDR